MPFLLLGLAYVLAYGYLGTNELAGILLFFTPWAVAIALTDPTPAPEVPPSRTLRNVLDPSTGTARLVACLGALLFCGMLLNTGSRSGLGALALVLPPLLWCLGRRGRRLLGAAAVGITGWLLWGGWETWLEFFVFDGKGQRLTFYTFLTGRPHIWLRHGQAVTDMPVTGVGLGASDVVVRELYPFSRFEPIVVIEDAHNVFLQVAVEMGLPCLLALLWLLAIAGQRLYARWRRAQDGPARAQILGLAAGLIAYLIYGLVDVVSWGRIGSLPFWCLLGLACRPPDAAAALSTGSRPLRPAVGAGILAALVLLAWGLRPILTFDLGVLNTAHALLVAPQRRAEALADMERHAQHRCQGHYFVARLASSQDDAPRRDAAYRSLIRCTDALDDLVAHLQPDHQELAQDAYRWHPRQAAAHLWRARQLARGSAPQRLRARAMFRTALDLDPSNGRAWIELGNLLYHENRREALVAYGEACERGDYYGQGCWQAGGTALELGDLDAAIHFYRSSRMPGSQAHAQGLEAQRRRRDLERQGAEGLDASPTTAPK